MTLQANKQTVVSYYTLAFNDKKPEEAVAEYVGAKYIQHNPRLQTEPQRSCSSQMRSPSVSRAACRGQASHN